MKVNYTEKEKLALRELKEKIANKYELIWMKLIGSKARGDSNEESDVDIVIVLKNICWEVEKDIYDICFYLDLEYDLVISPIIYSEEEIKSRLTQITPFYQRVETEGILL